MIEKLKKIDSKRLLNRRTLDLENKVILVDFWTYSCVNCLRTLPSLKSIYKTYNRHGFEILGVHTPEFEFEKNTDNIRRAIRMFEIDYPVINDFDYYIWNEFENKYRPAHYLFDKNGELVHYHFGEGGYQELSELISSLLSLSTSAPVEDDPLYYYGITPETYFGRLKGKIANGPSCYQSKCNYYVLPRRLSHGDVFLEGYWDVMDEYIQPDDDFSKLHIMFRSKEINVVADPDNNEYLHYLIDGTEMKIPLDFSRMYNLFKTSNVGEHTLTINAPRGMKLYVFTFG